MRKRYLVSLISLIGLVAVRAKRNKAKSTTKNSTFALSIEKAGIPDQMEIKNPTQLENSNMVSEGSQFGVHYFNELEEETLK